MWDIYSVPLVCVSSVNTMLYWLMAPLRSLKIKFCVIISIKNIWTDYHFHKNVWECLFHSTLSNIEHYSVFKIFLIMNWASQVVLMVKNLPAKAGNITDVGLIPGPGRFSGGGHGNPLQYSCLENSMDRGTWWATVHEVAKHSTWLKRLSVLVCSYELIFCLFYKWQALFLVYKMFSYLLFISHIY